MRFRVRLTNSRLIESVEVGWGGSERGRGCKYQRSYAGFIYGFGMMGCVSVRACVFALCVGFKYRQSALFQPIVT